MRHLLATALIATCIAAPAAAETAPLSETIIPDVPRMIERVKSGPFGRIWYHQDLEFVRGMSMGMLEGMAGDRLPEFEALLTDVRSVIIRSGGREDPTGGDLGDTTIVLHLPTRADQAVKLLRDDIARSGKTVPVQAVGPWVVLGRMPTDPTSLTLPAGAAVHDLTSHSDVAALGAQPGVPPEVGVVLRRLGLSSVTQTLRFDEQGTREEYTLPGFKPPFMPVDPKALAALPEGQLMVGALGIDGVALATLLDHLAGELPELAANLKAFDDTLTAKAAPLLAPTLRGWKGTVWFSVAQSAPFPTFSIGLPGSAEVDAVLAAVTAAGKLDLAEARKHAVVIPLDQGVPLLIQIRRTADQWVISSDQRVMDALDAPGAKRFQLTQVDGTTVGVFTQDLAGVVRNVMGYLPLLAAAAGGGDGAGAQATRNMIAMITKGLNAALPHLHPNLVLVRQDQRGVVVQGDNVTTAVAPMSILAGMMLPTIGMVRSQARRSQSGKNMSQIFGAMIAWSTTEEAWPPPSFTELAKSQSLPAKLFQSPSDPTHPAPYLFVPSIADPSAYQPVLIEDPACYKNQGTMVCFGDAHVKWFKGPQALRLWQEAKRLAALPKTTMGGIELADWAAVNDLLGLDPAPAAKPAPGPAIP